MHFTRSIPRLITQPTTAELVALALANGDFIGNICPHADLRVHAADGAADAAAEWEDEQDVLPGTVAPDLVAHAADMLLTLAYEIVVTAEQDAADARADAREAGDIDDEGDFIPYATHRSA